MNTNKSNLNTCCSERWILACMGLWLGAMTYLFAVNMSVTVVCMVHHEAPMRMDVLSNIERFENVNTSIVDREMRPNTTYWNAEGNKQEKKPSSFHDDKLDNHTKLKQTGEFTWSKKIQSLILSGYFYGYLVMQIPGGWLGAKYGGRRVIGTGMGLSTVLTLLIPVMARTSAYLVVVARILMGLFIGMTTTNFCGLIGLWALPTERSRMVGMLWCGQSIGAILAYSSSGVLCVNGFDNGWASVFYIHGTFGALFVGCWWYIAYSSPEEHPRITEEEKRLISKHNGYKNQYSERDPIPWRKILTHIPLYASYTAHACDNWAFYFLLTCLPQYMDEILHFNIQSNGLLSCLPLLSLMFGIIVSGPIADFVLSKTYFSVTTTRKIFLISGNLGITCFILLTAFLTADNRGLAITYLTISTVFMAFEETGGHSTNSVDIAPRYASVVFGISNTIATIPGAIVPTIVAALTPNQTVEEWRVVFYISAGVSVFSCIVYGLLANNELAPWAEEIRTVSVELYDTELTDVSQNAKNNSDIKNDIDMNGC